MVATVEDILDIIRSNPFIDGVGYFIEITASEPVPPSDIPELTDRMREAFCAHAQVTLEGEDVLGLDFHEHIFTQGEGAEQDLVALTKILRKIEKDYGIDHLCIELQFDMGRARRTQKEIDELLKP
jgi:microsomal dipeptidase-like Zn-dependent dipeptidase